MVSVRMVSTAESLDMILAKSPVTKKIPGHHYVVLQVRIIPLFVRDVEIHSSRTCSSAKCQKVCALMPPKSPRYRVNFLGWYNSS